MATSAALPARTKTTCERVPYMPRGAELARILVELQAEEESKAATQALPSTRFASRWEEALQQGWQAIGSGHRNSRSGRQIFELTPPGGGVPGCGEDTTLAATTSELILANGRLYNVPSWWWKEECVTSPPSPAGRPLAFRPG